MRSSGLRPTLLDSRHKSLPRNGWRGFTFELGQDRGNVCELTERHRSLCCESGQQTTRRRYVGLRFALQQEQRDFGGSRERDLWQLAGKTPNRENVAL
jgi:hypothetical protein